MGPWEFMPETYCHTKGRLITNTGDIAIKSKDPDFFKQKETSGLILQYFNTNQGWRLHVLIHSPIHRVLTHVHILLLSVSSLTAGIHIQAGAPHAHVPSVEGHVRPRYVPYQPIHSRHDMHSKQPTSP
jgi:hypothetical protein